MGPGKTWTHEELKFLRTNYETMSQNDLMNGLPGRTWYAISGTACQRFHLRRQAFMLRPIRINLDPTKWAYIAGLLDGEGSINFVQGRYVVRGRAHYRLNPQVSISNTDASLMDFLRILGIGHFLTHANNKPNSKPINDLQLTSMAEISVFLEGVLPYLVIKKHRAELMLRFIHIRMIRHAKFGRGSPQQRKGFSLESPWGEELAIYEEVRRLNKRGVRDA